MRAFEFGNRVLSITVAALLCACGASAIPTAINNASSDVAALKGSKTFHYTGEEQTFTVPAGVKQLTVVARGGEGAGSYYYPSTDTPGRPGRVYAIVPVHGGDKLYVFVGGSGTHGGFNGGAAGGDSGNSGGGASDVRTGGDSLPDRILVAAGGGGAGGAFYVYGTDYGGNGGGLAGLSGKGGGSRSNGGGGEGGTQSAGGSGGPGGVFCLTYRYYPGEPGGNGALGVGGDGGDGSPYKGSGGGGGGGGGYYGGGGGGGGAAVVGYCYAGSGQGGGGGGGSSYVEPNAIKSRMWTGWKSTGDGLVVFSWK